MFKTPNLKQNTDNVSPVMEQQYVDEAVGPPRTPSPSASPTCNQMNYMNAYHQNYNKDKNNIIRVNPALYKYQRQESEKKQARPDQHYKKKFYYREWKGSKEDNSNWDHDVDNHSNDSSVNQKSKFQKSHEWEWNKDVNSEFNNTKSQNSSDSSNQWIRPGMHDMYNVSNNWKN